MKTNQVARHSLCLGSNNTVMHSHCIVLGDGLATNRDYQLLTDAPLGDLSIDLTPEMHAQLVSAFAPHLPVGA